MTVYSHITTGFDIRPRGETTLKEIDLKNDVPDIVRLTEKERALLDVLLDPEMANSTHVERFEAAGLSKQGYYDILKRPHFRALVSKMLYDTIYHESLPMMHAALKAAKSGSFAHFKLLMEMGGLHTDASKVVHEGAVEHIVTFSTKEPDELPVRQQILDAEWTEGPEESE